MWLCEYEWFEGRFNVIPLSFSIDTFSHSWEQLRFPSWLPCYVMFTRSRYVSEYLTGKQLSQILLLCSAAGMYRILILQ